MSVAQRPLTYDDLRQLPDDGNRYELIDGELVVVPAPSWVHQEIVVRVLRLLLDYLSRHVPGSLALPAPVNVRLTPTRVVQPDVVVVLPEQRSLLDDIALIDGAPALVVEVISPSSRPRDELVKRRFYEAAGVREYWLVDLSARSVTILKLTESGYVAIEPGGGSVASALLPGLVVDALGLFAGLPE